MHVHKDNEAVLEDDSSEKWHKMIKLKPLTARSERTRDAQKYSGDLSLASGGCVTVSAAAVANLNVR